MTCPLKIINSKFVIFEVRNLYRYKLNSTKLSPINKNNTINAAVHHNYSLLKN